MKYYIIAGEASGDLHASNLMKELKKSDPEAVFRCWGGEWMKGQGGELVMHYRDTAFMGFTEVLLHLPKILKLLKYCKRDILLYKPDALILVDYPGFNLRMASFAHRQGLRVIYYISPQVWAWKSSRIAKIKAHVDRMYVILPFEESFYRRYGFKVEYVGHPLLDALAQIREDKPLPLPVHDMLYERPVVALLPGSRKQEIARILPVMLSVVGHFPTCQFVVAGLSIHRRAFYDDLLKDKDAIVVYDQTYSLLKHAGTALVTSGTATLETALLGVPQVICYKGGTVSYQIAKRLVDVPYIGLVNLIMEKEIVKELIQKDLNPRNVTRELGAIIEGGSRRDQVLKDYGLLERKLGGTGASSRVAGFICNYLRESKKVH